MCEEQLTGKRGYLFSVSRPFDIFNSKYYQQQIWADIKAFCDPFSQIQPDCEDAGRSHLLCLSTYCHMRLGRGCTFWRHYMWRWWVKDVGATCHFSWRSWWASWCAQRQRRSPCWWDIGVGYCQAAERIALMPCKMLSWVKLGYFSSISPHEQVRWSIVSIY